MYTAYPWVSEHVKQATSSEQFPVHVLSRQQSVFRVPERVALEGRRGSCADLLLKVNRLLQLYD